MLPYARAMQTAGLSGLPQVGKTHTFRILHFRAHVDDKPGRAATHVGISARAGAAPGQAR